MSEVRGLHEVVTDQAVAALSRVIEDARKVNPVIVDNNTIEVTVTIHSKVGDPWKATAKWEVE